MLRSILFPLELSDSEGRGVWFHSKMFGNDRIEVIIELKNTLNQYETIGINHIFCFDTLMEEHLKGWDFLKVIIIEAHKRRINIHPIIMPGYKIENKTVVNKKWLIKGVEGLNLDKKRRLISLLKDKGKIFITTEKEIDPEFKQYRSKVSPEKIHSLLYYATMFIGDSQTMTSEAAVLGTPAIRCNDFVGRISYLEEEEHKYGLTYGFKPDDFEKMLVKIDELLKMSDLKEEWQKRRERMLKDKIDVTAFMVWFVENYPESVKIMKKNPRYQERFK